MAGKYRIEDMAKKIRILKKNATELKKISAGIQAVDKNVDRILASIKMLEINISDLFEMVEDN